jgi:hypothetical protein
VLDVPAKNGASKHGQPAEHDLRIAQIERDQVGPPVRTDRGFLLTGEVSMPWTETAPMTKRMRFVTDWERDLYSMVELCERHGVSRKTGYKWIARYEDEGLDGLRERRRAPHHCPHRIAPEVAALICAARRQHPSWGPAKLVAWLRPRHPAATWPAVSTAGDPLARHGLVKKRRRRRHYQHPGVVPATTKQPNDLWTADFKGHLRTRDGIYCYPLTIAD